eukprot:c10223_g1_i1 orf=81-248(+)
MTCPYQEIERTPQLSPQWAKNLEGLICKKRFDEDIYLYEKSHVVDMREEEKVGWK